MGVGYRYHDVYMNVLALFPDKMVAHNVWKKTVDWWPDVDIKLSFVEESDNYWFILYGGSEYSGDNTGFVKRLPLSDNYKRFKRGYEKKAMLRFGAYKENTDPRKKDRDGVMKKFELEVLRKAKSIYNISFLNISDLQPGSVEWQCIQTNPE